MKKLREYFVAHYFLRMSNGKFLIVEGAFIYMVIACGILTYGTLEFYNDWLIIPFMIPFLYGVYLFIFAPKIKFIDDLHPHWRTQLRVLKDPRMSHVFTTEYDKQVERRLEERWKAEYGEPYGELTFVKLQKWQPVALTIICLMVYVVWEIL